MIFSGKVVIVTGSARGIGKGTAELFGTMGASVVIADNNRDMGKETSDFLQRKGINSLFIECDISRPREAENLMILSAEKFGKLDVLINNAGISAKKALFDITEEDWRKVIDTNLGGVFFCSKAASKIMKKTGGGVIINIASTRAFMSESGSEAYAASKGGIISLTHALAASLAPERIRVNSISPGWIETGDYGELRKEDHMQHFSGRVGMVSDIAQACVFLASPENSFINGTNLVIDGGMTKKMIYIE